MLSLDSIVVAAKEQVSADLGGEMAILNLHNGVYYGLNEVGTRVWELIQEPIVIGQVRNVIWAEYDVEPEQCARDVLALLEEMMAEALIEVRNGPGPH